MTDIRGDVEEGYGRVADAFRANFDDIDIGAAFCLYHHGRKVVDLAGGTADESTGRPYDRDTLQLVFSTTKGITAVAIAMAVEAGHLDYDAPVASLWPEFAANGKADLPVSWVMSHRSGLWSIDADLTMDEVLAVRPVVEALAAQEPLTSLDGRHSYHAITYGWLAGEILRRATGVSIHEFVQRHIAEPLAVEFYMGLPSAEHGRVAPMLASAPLADPAAAALVESILGEGTPAWRALSLDGRFTMRDARMTWNQPEVWSSEIPGVGGISNAASIARIYAATVGEVDGVRLLSSEVVDRATTRVTEGGDGTLVRETAFGMGFMLPGAKVPLPGPRSFGHPGAGGSLGYADPDLGIGFGYAMNQMGQGMLGDARTHGLTEAVVAAVS